MANSTSLRASDPVKEKDQKRGGITKAKLKQFLGTHILSCMRA